MANLFFNSMVVENRKFSRRMFQRTRQSHAHSVRYNTYILEIKRPGYVRTYRTTTPLIPSTTSTPHDRPVVRRGVAVIVV